jgi:hypothetical protein
MKRFVVTGTSIFANHSAPVYTVTADYYEEVDGTIHFFHIPAGEVEGQQIATFAPGRWESVVRENG